MEDHPDGAPHKHWVDVGGVDVLTVEKHLTTDSGTGSHLVHAVDGPEHGRLSAPGGADEAHDRLGSHLQAHTLHGKKIAVVDVEVLQLDPELGNSLGRDNR